MMDKLQFESLSRSKQLYAVLSGFTNTPGLSELSFESLERSLQMWWLYVTVSPSPIEKYRYYSLSRSAQWYFIYIELESSPIERLAFESLSRDAQLFLVFTALGGSSYKQHFLSLTRDEQLFLIASESSDSFSIEYDPGVLNLTSGQSGDVTVSIILLRGSEQMVTLTVPDLPPGWTAVFSVNPVPTGSTSVMTVTVP